MAESEVSERSFCTTTMTLRVASVSTYAVEYDDDNDDDSDFDTRTKSKRLGKKSSVSRKKTKLPVQKKVRMDRDLCHDESITISFSVCI